MKDDEEYRKKRREDKIFNNRYHQGDGLKDDYLEWNTMKRFRYCPT